MDKGNGGVGAFRNAARDATALYKGIFTIFILFTSLNSLHNQITESFVFAEGMESGRRLSELGCTLGYTRRSKEILSWAKKRRKFIRSFIRAQIVKIRILIAFYDLQTG
jgi:hypothetical protein